jgi:hypothetical protein
MYGLSPYPAAERQGQKQIFHFSTPRTKTCPRGARFVQDDNLCGRVLAVCEDDERRRFFQQSLKARTLLLKFAMLKRAGTRLVRGWEGYGNSVAGEGEDYVDGGFYGDGLVVELVGAVAPLLDGVEGGLAEEWMAGEDAEVFYLAGGGDGGGEDYGAGDVADFGDGGVDGLGFAQEQADGYGGRDRCMLRRGGMRYGRGFGLGEDAGQAVAAGDADAGV